MSTRPEPPRFGVNAQVHQEGDLRVPREGSLEAELARLGFLPTKEDPVFYRGLGRIGFGLFLYLEDGLDLQTLGRLADSRDRAALIRRIVDLA